MYEALAASTVSSAPLPGDMPVARASSSAMPAWPCQAATALALQAVLAARPALAADFSNLPPAFVLTAGYDPLS